MPSIAFKRLNCPQLRENVPIFYIVLCPTLPEISICSPLRALGMAVLLRVASTAEALKQCPLSLLSITSIAEIHFMLMLANTSHVMNNMLTQEDYKEDFKHVYQTYIQKENIDLHSN